MSRKPRESRRIRHVVIHRARRSSERGMTIRASLSVDRSLRNGMPMEQIAQVDARLILDAFEQCLPVATVMQLKLLLRTDDE